MKQTDVEFEDINYCPVCNYDGKTIFQNCQDYNFGISGNWNINQCNNCHSYWLNPRPRKEFIPFLYPSNYCTHTKPRSLLEEPQGFFNKVRFAIKIAILEKKYGYQNLSGLTSLPWIINIGKLLSIIPFFSNTVGYMIRYLKYKPGARLLEVGVGNGQYLMLMKELGWEVEGIEPDTKASKIVQEMGFNIQSCSVEEANLNPNYYDAIVLHHVTEHLANPKTTLLNLITSLRVNGSLVSISPNPRGLLASIFQKYWYNADIPRHLVLPSPKGYVLMFLESGLKIKVWTTMQISYWAYRESLSIQKTESVGQLRDSLLLKLISIFLKASLFIKPEWGEEVICVVTRK